MKIARKEYETRAEKTKDFFLGVLIFIVMNGLLLVAINAASIGLNNAFPNQGDVVVTILGCLPFLINAVLMIGLAFLRPWIALGMLGTIAFLLALALALGIVAGVACLVILLSSGSGGL
jgi:hypothetical protein